MPSNLLWVALVVVACGPSGGEPSSASGAATTCARASTLGSYVEVPAGSFVTGASPMYPEEGPAVRVHVSGFLLKAHEVTNDEFASFVKATGYVTEAERGGGSAQFVDTATPDVAMSWWRLDATTTWRTPEGAGSDLRGREHHPVVHMTLEDARRYAEWAGGRLPHEVEWEYAATLGLANPENPESGAFESDGAPRANVWTGTFPSENNAADGYVGAAPVGSFPADEMGAYDLIGNVWEWTETPFVANPALQTIKGGSHLCTVDHCRRFRPSARQGLEPDFSTSHTGFRIIRDLAPASGR